MNTDIPRFWPQDPGHQPEGPQPEDILHDAATELGRVTNQEVRAEVRTRAAGEWLEHEFYLVSDKLGYRYLLFRARNQLGFPVSIFDLPGEDDPDPDRHTQCATSDELERILKQLFELPVTQQIVGQLRNLARAAS
ncbi:hypothetical protein ENSA5_05160 [Enhygromyxa salina]|uniref:Uncharacterized protein n=1 Tax=Enhygromyxa salina TaxID=215803 RepID=A0A2S9YI62_9BACT|nr:hypothetical protein [Enhygromyxa salina]PRQ04751.1 hypothetical protein ENSA5_05160 [Enhygromyxa salina]